jgi:hypothetical protein
MFSVGTHRCPEADRLPQALRLLKSSILKSMRKN